MATKEKSSSRWLACLAPILFLLAAATGSGQAAVAADVPASASMAGALETRAWEKTSVPLESRPLESLQLLNLHQQNEVADDNDALGSPLAAESGVAERGATGFRGNEGFELKNAPYQPVRNAAGEVNGQGYSGHAFDQMQNRGLMPSVVDNTIQNGTNFSTRAGTTGYYDAVNNVRVIVNSNTGQVVTVIRGAP